FANPLAPPAPPGTSRTPIELEGGVDEASGEPGTSDWGGGAAEDPLNDDIPMGLPASVVVRVSGAALVGPTATMRAALNDAFARVPQQLAFLLREVVLEADGASAAVSGAPSAEEKVADGGVPPLPALRSASRGRVSLLALTGGSCRIDMSGKALAEYVIDTSALSRELNLALAKSYVYRAAKLELAVGFGFEVKDASFFPDAIKDLLQNHLAPLLAAGEGLLTAWSNLHAVAVSAGLAKAYASEGIFSPNDDAEAIAGGFASKAASRDPQTDFAEFLTAALVPATWASRPCEALRAKALDELAPSLLVHVAKLLALRGLALIGGSQLRSCVGELRIAAADVNAAGGIVLHKPDGERIAFTKDLEGLRQPYFQDELQLSWKAERAYAGLSISAGFRGATPGVMRFAAAGSGNEETPISRAVLAFTNPDGYQTSVAKGGLLAIRAVRRDALDGFGLMIVLSSEQAGTKIFPLVSAQVKRPVWGDAP
ncbi:MAG TPA: hypothetical protein VFX59_05875, partial [Polyangiales bacterium]|nr:hypothetical protein [Polyangiales bacterium]